MSLNRFRNDKIQFINLQILNFRPKLTKRYSTWTDMQNLIKFYLLVNCNCQKTIETMHSAQAFFETKTKTKTGRFNLR